MSVTRSRDVTATAVVEATIRGIRYGIREISVTIMAIISRYATVLARLCLRSRHGQFRLYRALISVLNERSRLKDSDDASSKILSKDVVSREGKRTVLCAFVCVNGSTRTLLLLCLLSGREDLEILRQPRRFFTFVVEVFDRRLNGRLVVAVVGRNFDVVRRSRFLATLLLRKERILLVNEARVNGGDSNELSSIARDGRLTQLASAHLRSACLNLLIRRPSER